MIKSRKAIFKAFRFLLTKKRYDKITVQEIIDEADVGRSTFYAHFETKDLLLDALCEDIFYHIFESDPCPWVNKDYDLQSKLSHILFHISEEQSGFSAVMISDSSDIFMRYFKEHLRKIFEVHLYYFKSDVPKEFLLNFLVGSFSETVIWWVSSGMKTSPEATAEYFMKVIERH